jgi:predicted nucleic acid-binding protein
VVIDTDVVSFMFKKDTRAVQFRQHLRGRTLLISFMTLAELHGWAIRNRWGQTRREQLFRHLARYGVHYPDALTCEQWAEVDSQARLKGRPITCADAWIAATALRLGVPLVTHNPSDYASAVGLTVLSGTS